MAKNSSEEFSRALRLLPTTLRSAVSDLPESVTGRAEELRLRAGRPIGVVVGDKEMSISQGVYITPAELQMVLEIATRASVHSYSESIRKGFVTADGGCRLGLCGMASCEGGKISGMRRLSSICIRIPHERRGCAEEIFPKLTASGFGSTLIISPPGGGKTTLLRELIRLLSDGGARVALADERSEVAGCFEGRPCFDVGTSTDVLTAAPKSEGIFLLLRAMSPQIIAFDEITSPHDVEACEAAANCGVKLLATAHGASLEDLRQRPIYARLLERRIFDSAVIIENNAGVRAYSVKELK